MLTYTCLCDVYIWPITNDVWQRQLHLHNVLMLSFQLMFYFSEGRKHDAGMLTDSNLWADLSRYAISATGQPLCIYGDPAYPLRVNLQGPFRNAVLTPQMEVYNEAMSSVRSSVEWLFGDIKSYFKLLDFILKNLKIGFSSVGKIYIVCALLRKSLTCLYGNNTSEFFQSDPPDLFTYFA